MIGTPVNNAGHSGTHEDASELRDLQNRFNALPRQLSTAAQNIDTVLNLAAEARIVPLSEIIPIDDADKEGFACLRQIRSEFIGRVIVFRRVLLPVSRDVVNGLHSFLEYMEDEETFLMLARAQEVSSLCARHANEALNVQEGYEALAADLRRLGQQMDDKFQKVRLDVEKLLQRYKQQQKLASTMKLAATGLTGLGLTVGIVLACGLLGPAGVLFAPALAPVAFSACAAGGGAAAVAMGQYASERTERGVALRETAQVLHEAQTASQQQLPNAVDRFADAMTHLAQFFSKLHGGIQRIEASAARIEGRLRENMLDESYRALYRVLCTQMGKVKQSCDEYMQFVAIVNIKVNSLQVNEEKPALSYIEEWFAEQQENSIDANALQRLQVLLNRYHRGLPADGKHNGGLVPSKSGQYPAQELRYIDLPTAESCKA